MKKKRRIFSLILSVGIVSSLFTGCSSKDVERVKVSSAEEALELFNKYNQEDNVEEMVKLYADVYMDAVGYPTGSIIKMLKDNRKNIKIKKSETVQVEDINETTKKAQIVSTAVKDDKEESYTYTYGVIKENGGWAISPDGVIGFEDYKAPKVDKENLNFYLSKAIITFDAITYRAEVYNYTSNKYQFGIKNDFSKIKVETTEGEFETAMEDIALLDKKTQTYFTARVEGVKGELKKITLTNLYDCDKDGKVLNDSKRDIVVYEKK